MNYDPRHRANDPRHRGEPVTARRLRRSLLTTTLATMAITSAASGGSSAFVLTGAATAAATPFGPTSPSSYSTPSEPVWDDPVVVTPSREAQRSPRDAWHAGADRIDEIPDAALAAYQRSAAVMDKASPGSRLHWTLLAAVGRVLTDHGLRGDHRVDDRGNVRPGIVGKPVLARGGQRVGDTEAGLLDKDRRFDRPVGPMLLTPADWSVVGVDGDTDGKRNPQDLDDASLALAVLLCAPGENLRTTEGKRAALPRINESPDFVRAVLEVEADYRRQLRSGAVQVETGPLTTLPELPSLPTRPTAKPDQAPQSRQSRQPADSGIVSSRVPDVRNESPDHADPDDGSDLPTPEPQPVPSSTDVTATYDSAGSQISATAVVRAAGLAPTGGVTFTLTGPNGAKVAQAALAGGSATAQFEVTNPGAYTVTAWYAGTEDHLGSEGSFVVQVTLPPSTEPAAKATD